MSKIEGQTTGEFHALEGQHTMACHNELSVMSVIKSQNELAEDRARFTASTVDKSKWTIVHESKLMRSFRGVTRPPSTERLVTKMEFVIHAQWRL